MEHGYLLSTYHFFLFSCHQLLFFPLYQFPEATVTNYKLGGLTQQKLLSYSSEAPNPNLVLLGQNHGFLSGTLPSEALQGNPFLVQSIFWWLPVFFGFWSHHSTLANYSSKALSPELSISFVLLALFEKTNFLELCWGILV